MGNGSSIPKSPSSGADATTSCDSTTTPCPHEKRIINARWGDATVKCGDNAGMLADTQNIPENTKATFTVKQISDNSTITTVNSDTGGSSVAGEWISQKPSDKWEDAEVKFTAEASGVKGDSEGDQLSFHKYPEIIRHKRSHTRQAVNNNDPANPVVYADLKGKYTIEFTDRQLIIKVRVKLLNKQGARPANQADYGTVANGPAVSNKQKNKMKNKIEKVLSKQLDLHRKNCPRGDGCNCPRENKCCKFEIIVQVFFVEKNEHHVINLWPAPAQRHNAANWHVAESRPGKSWAHETGHLLGWYDEYTDGAHPPAGSDPAGRWLDDRPNGIMGAGSVVYWDHFEDFRSWFVGETSEKWRLIKR